ncbi:site-specific DNA-methyltransferase [Albidovulum salinarum]
MRSIESLGFNAPIVIDEDNMVLAGHGRLEAAKRLGMSFVPCFRVTHLSAEEARAFVLADNRLAEDATWDDDLLAEELKDLFSQPDLTFEVEVTGFTLAEIDDRIGAQDPEALDDPEDDLLPAVLPRRVYPGDLWQIGAHRLLCADARDPVAYEVLVEDRKVRMVFTDPPYNVPIEGHVSGGGKIRHREFDMAVGEMTSMQFTAFLRTVLDRMAGHCHDGAILMVCMDWRHMVEMVRAGRDAGLVLKNLCVWAKTNGGMGTFYRSRHELVFVFKAGTAPHVNTFGLGEGGRYRTNVWEYPGATALTAEGRSDLASHPTVKPVRLVADAIRDVTGRGDIVLDAFGGSGTTLVAAERTGRIAALIELDPRYGDLILARAEKATKEDAVQLVCGWPRRLDNEEADQ